MRVGVMVQREHGGGPTQSEVTVTIPKKKWIKDYFSFGGAKGYPELGTNCSSPSMISPVPVSNEFASQPRGISVPNGQHYVSQSHSLPSFKSHLGSSPGIQRPSVVPEPINGFKVELTYRRTSMSGSPEFEHFPGYIPSGNRPRIAKSVSPNSISGLNNRNSGTREVHNKLEKNRRAHLKECFELLKSNLPSFEDRKISNLAILRSSLRHIQNLKRKEKDLEHEMERLARDKIALQQRLQIMKKDMAGQWDHHQLDWRASEGIEIDIDGTDCRRSPSSTETTVTLSPDRVFLDRYSESSDSSSPTNNTNRSHASGHDMEMDDSGSDSQQPLSLTVNNCHITEQKVSTKYYGQVNGVNGVSDKGPISLLTTNLISPSSLAGIHGEKMANSPTGGATFLMAKNSGKMNGFTILENAIIATSKDDIGQYYQDKICK